MSAQPPRPTPTFPELIVLCILCMIAAWLIDRAGVALGIWQAETPAWFAWLESDGPGDRPVK